MVRKLHLACGFSEVCSEQPEVVVKNRAVLMESVLWALILLDPGIPEARREPIEERPLGPPLEIGVKFVFVGHFVFGRRNDPVPAMNEENRTRHAFYTYT